MKNKNIKALSLLLILIIVALFSTGCKDQTNDGETACNHEYGKWSREGDKYCNESVFSQICSKCGDIKTKQGSESDHDWQLINTVSATCSDEGYSERSCSTCGKTEKFDIVEKTDDHGWSDPITMSDPTCGESGLSVLMCYKCHGNKLVFIPPTGEHSFNADGICTTCGHSVEE